MRLGTVNNSASLLADITFWTGADSSSYSVKDRVRNMNEWYRVVNQEIWKHTGAWQYDDKNYTTLPYATGNLVANQRDYSLPTSAQRLEAVEVLDKNGDWNRLRPIDISEIKDVAYEEVYNTSGFPVYYDILGSSFNLLPKPAGSEVTTTSGLRVYVSRNIDPLVVTSTTTTPGFSEDFHRILSLGASLDYLAANNADNVKLSRVQGEINDMMKAVEVFYSMRNREEQGRMIPRVDSKV